MRRSGFTLIELLAVILILGIIALIAIPTVNKIIEQSRKGAFETTANNVAGAIEAACQLQTLKGEAITTTYTFTDGVVSPTIEIKGDLPTDGTATVDSSCKVTLNVTNGKFTATKAASADSVTISDGGEITETYTVYANGTAVYFNPVAGVTCTAGEAVSTPETKNGCMKWYTFKDGGASSDTVNLILDHNTTETVAWNTVYDNRNGPNQILTQLQTDTSSWAGVPIRTDSYNVSNGTANYTINYSTYKARLITADEIASITANVTFNEITATNYSWFYFDSNNQTKIATTQGASNYDWLFDYTTGCTNSGCNVDDTTGYNLGYWTSTAVAGDHYYTWLVHRLGALGCDDVDFTGYYGLRPVITLLKSSL